jgi:hypothetical protein
MSLESSGFFIPGSTVKVKLYSINFSKAAGEYSWGQNSHSYIYGSQKRYRLIKFAGSGLGGMVYQARDLDTRELVAIKIYSPTGTSGLLKRLIRNFFHLFCFQSLFPYKYIKSALLSNLVANYLLRLIIEKEIGYSFITQCYGIFFNSESRSWAQVDQWVHGGNKINSLAQQKDFIAALRRFRIVAQRAGFRDHSYQIEDRFLAPAHTHQNIIQDSDGHFWWVDKMPAVPVMLLIYPYHFAAIISLLRRGRMHWIYDSIDIKFFKHYVDTKVDARDKNEYLRLLNLYLCLQKDYHGSRLAMFSRLNPFTASLSWGVRDTLIEYWLDCDDISQKGAQVLQRSPVLFFLFSLLNFIPILGRVSRQLFLNSRLWHILAKFSWPLYSNHYRNYIIAKFRLAANRRIIAWVIKDLNQMQKQGLIEQAEIDKFQQEFVGQRWSSYVQILFLYTLAKLPGDMIVVGFGGYALVDLWRMLQINNFYLSLPLVLGIASFFLPGLYRLLVTLIYRRLHSDTKFSWYWTFFSVLPSVGYLAVPAQVLNLILSKKIVWRLFVFKISSAFWQLIDIIPGWREIKFYLINPILLRIKKQ